MSQGAFLNLDPPERKRLRVAAAEGEMTMTEVVRQALAIWHGIAPQTRTDLLRAVGYVRLDGDGALTPEDAAESLLSVR